MRRIILFFICTPFLVHSYGRDLDQSLFQRIREGERLQRKESFEKTVRFFDTEIAAHSGRDAELAYLHAYKSRFYTLNDSLVLAKKEAGLSLVLAERSKNAQAKAAALLAQMYISAVLGLADHVVRHGKEAINISLSSDDYFTLFLINYKLYATYSDWEETDKMTFYINRCVKMAQRLGDPNALANAYNGVSSTFLTEYEASKNRVLIDSSWVYLRKSFELYETHPSEIAETTLSVTCSNIANHFLSYSKSDVSEAQKMAFKYLDMVESMPQDALVLAHINGIKSVFALRENNLDAAKGYLERAREVIEREPQKNLSTKIHIYRSLVTILSEQGELKTALEYWQRIDGLQAELFDEQQRYNAQKIDIQYEVEKKDEELEYLSTEVRSRKEQNYLYIGIAVLSVIGLIFMFTSYHFRLKYSIERERKAHLEKEEAEMQMLLEQEEKQRLKAEQELLGMQQLQLQKEAMATVLQVQRKNEILQEIKAKLSEGSPEKIQKIFKEESSVDADFDEIKTQIQRLYPNFFQHLQEMAQQKLSLLDLKYCACIHLKMSTKQMAQLLHVEASSVRMFKYRLKQKLGLSKEVDLEAFLQNFN